MIRREWAPPNVRIVARWRGGSPQRWLTSGESPVAVKRRLEDDGWTVTKAVDYDFSEWERKAETLRTKAHDSIAKVGKTDFKPSQWGILKRHLFELFEGKCAYCESKPEVVEPGDVEHYRPKRTPTDAPGHPGYFWLAYDPHNLLPSCNKCNRGPGKKSQFPLDGDARAMSSADDLDGEQPLLLTPYGDDDPRTHFTFLPTGDVEGKGHRGCVSVRVYGLDRRDLIIARAEMLGGLENEMNVAILDDEIDWEVAARNKVAELLEGRAAYSASLLTHMLHIAHKNATKEARAALRKRLEAETQEREAAEFAAEIERLVGV